MGPPLDDDSWTRRGISLLWDAEALPESCTPQQVRQPATVPATHARGWPEADLPLVGDTTLVVAGLEGASMPCRPRKPSTGWSRSSIRRSSSYQREVADGGSQAALVFWLAEPQPASPTTTQRRHLLVALRRRVQGRRQIPLSRCLFNGAQHDLDGFTLPTTRRPNTGSACITRGFHERRCAIESCSQPGQRVQHAEYGEGVVVTAPTRWLRARLLRQPASGRCPSRRCALAVGRVGQIVRTWRPANVAPSGHG